MRLGLVGVVLLGLGVPVAADEPQVGVVVSRSIAPYLSAADGIQDVLRRASITAIQLYDMAGDAAQAQHIAEVLTKQPPRLVVTVGSEATQAMRERLHDIPIVCSMVVNPEQLADDRPLYGALMEVSAAAQLSQLKSLLPTIRRIGILFTASPKALAAMARRQDAARQQGLELVLRAVQGAGDIPSALRELLSGVDALWLVPDDIVLAPQTAQNILLETLRYKVPVLAPSLLFVQRGALLAVGTDYQEVGRQAGELALQLLAGKQPPTNLVEARKPVIYLNLRSARTLRITVPQAVIDQAGQVIR